jgi:hypothetical protein
MKFGGLEYCSRKTGVQSVLHYFFGVSFLRGFSCICANRLANRIIRNDSPSSRKDNGEYHRGDSGVYTG